MKTKDQIQRAHDLLSAIILGEVPNPFPIEEKGGLVACLNALCWVLGHDHNVCLAENLAYAEAWLKDAGFEFAEIRVQ